MKFSRLAVAATIAFSASSINAAQYRLEPLPLDTVSINHFAQAIADDGTVVATTQNEFNPPIDLTLLDFDSESLINLLTDVDAARAGNFNLADYTTLVNLLLSARANNSVTLQRLAEFRSYFVTGAEYDLIPGLDIVTETFDDYTNSVNVRARDILGSSTVVGSSDAPYLTVDYVNADGDEQTFVLSDHITRGFVEVNGVTTGLTSVETRLGGYSEAYAINSNMQVAGFGATELYGSGVDLIDTCADPEVRGDIPEELCLRNIRETGAGTTNALRASARTRPHIWQLDVNGAVINVETYDLLFTPEENDTFNYIARAFDINDAGIAVGDSMTGEGVVVTRPGSSFGQTEAQLVATMYSNGVTTELLPREENQLSNALLINDDYIVGTVTRESNGVSRETLFVYDLATETVEYPSGFFSTAGTTPRAINDNNIIVGESEVEASVETVREKNAFMFNIDTQEFINLNTLIECDSEYTLVDAVDINNNNEIVVNARLRAPSKEVNGEPVLNDAGETTLVDTVYAVKLIPIPNGEIDDCQFEVEVIERQGASWNFGLVALLLAMIVRRRRKV
ncbi:DUF3466 family protein [Alteromonas sp. ASW11-36]|uniref:DUF3466 family protein n=1 Tax=Alteromonas arenosi TaxID=3055817 RepID=A0ABT7SXZ0_9ALTE|nr:DUF3466 family protein [Alteromonas sp. ASW11-36]MDM7860869.1 DUF3466 family protein [Alteromonas sp. ASW11-36]